VKGKKRSRRDRDEDDEDEWGRIVRQGGTPTGRVYVHDRCGGFTQVSGGDYTHICDPFWPCTGTYCCTCADFAPLHEVRWADTGEPVSDYRARMRAETPGLLKAWRFGLGALPGGALGALLGWLAAVISRVPENQGLGFTIVGGIVGAILCYVVGAMILTRAFGMDYRRIR
jgi:hypothetical protein